VHRYYSKTLGLLMMVMINLTTINQLIDPNPFPHLLIQNTTLY